MAVDAEASEYIYNMASAAPEGSDTRPLRCLTITTGPRSELCRRPWYWRERATLGAQALIGGRSGVKLDEEFLSASGTKPPLEDSYLASHLGDIRTKLVGPLPVREVGTWRNCCAAVCNDKARPLDGQAPILRLRRPLAEAVLAHSSPRACWMILGLAVMSSNARRQQRQSS